MKNDRLGANLLSALLIPNVDSGLAASLELKPHHRSLGIVTSDCDDVTYVALDEATKAADVEVVYARSMYAGAGNASTKLAGEVIGILAGPNPEEVRMTTASHILLIAFQEQVVIFRKVQTQKKEQPLLI